MLSLCAVEYVSRVRPRTAQRESHADAHSAAFNPGVMSMSRPLHMHSAHAVVPDPVMSAAVLKRPVLEHAPPAPPPPANSGGGGGDGDNSPRYLYHVSRSEAEALLADWTARTRIYSMAGQFGNAELAELHRKSLEELNEFGLFLTEWWRTEEGRPIVLGLYSHNRTQPWALAGGREIGKSTVTLSGGALTTKHIAVKPAELNDGSSVADLTMRQGLRNYQKKEDLEDLVLPLVPDPDGDTHSYG